MDEPFDIQTYQQAIGCLTYMSTSTRPDIATAVGILSQYTLVDQHQAMYFSLQMVPSVYQAGNNPQLLSSQLKLNV